MSSESPQAHQQQQYASGIGGRPKPASAAVHPDQNAAAAADTSSSHTTDSNASQQTSAGQSQSHTGMERVRGHVSPASRGSRLVAPPSLCPRRADVHVRVHSLAPLLAALRW
jgi:hypothetical protein